MSEISVKDKMVADLRLAKQNQMADFIANNKDPKLEAMLIEAFKNKRYLAFCKTCGKVYVDMPFADFYRAHTFPEWDIWFCDAVLHWAETEGKHSIYCYSGDHRENSYDLSSSLAYDCRNESWKQIHGDMKDVVKMKAGFMKIKAKNVNWINPSDTTLLLTGEQ